MCVITYERAAFTGCEESTEVQTFQKSQLFKALILKSIHLAGKPLRTGLAFLLILELQYRLTRFN